MKQIYGTVAALAVFGAGAAWVMSAPRGVDVAAFEAVVGNAAAGETVFWAAGCASCHQVTGGDALVLAGGQAFATQFGTFYAPNISPDPIAGIGGWDLIAFANAVQKGVSPEGAHYFPALPYAAYAKMTAQDVADLKAFMDALPPDATPSQPHDIAFPFNIRRSLGFWKLLFMNENYVIAGDLTEQQQRGRYIAEALAHCSECHTPRGVFGNLDRSNFLAGAASPDGKSRVPNITPEKLTWSDAELASYFTTGFTPEFDVVGGHMAHVVENMARLPESDRAALIAYLRLVPAQLGTIQP
jgi:mono/diheme cytochrome c family protein